MAGHSQFANIKHRKNAQDAKRSGVFTKIRRQIIVAARSGGGPDPDLNQTLRSVIHSAKRMGFGNDKIEAALKDARGAMLTDDYEEVRYECYGGHGSAIIITALTNNKNRTAGEIRHMVSHGGGSLVENGNLSFMFDHLGMICYPKKTGLSYDALLETALEHGADNIEEREEDYRIYCEIQSYGGLHKALVEAFGEPETSRLTWKPKEIIKLEDAQLESLMQLVDKLEDYEDVQHVETNIYD